jgi:hypothetical protein
MKIIDQLRAKLATVGATLDEGDHVLNCDAPSGYVWASTDCRAVPITYANHSQTWAVEAIRLEDKDRLAMGLRKVTDEKELAAIRWDTGEDDWGAPADAPERIAWPKGGL